MKAVSVNLRNLDALRGALAVYVLLGHARWLLWCGHASFMVGEHSLWIKVLAASSALFRYGHEAVMVFFVLSGFFIHLRAAQQLAATGSVASLSAGLFYRRRLHRLLGPYVLALCLTVAVDFCGRKFFPTLYAGQTGDALLDANFARKNFSWQAVVSALVFLPTGLGVDFGSNGPLWSLGCEVVYYAAYPAWLAVRRHGVGWAYALAGIFLAVNWLPLPGMMGFVAKSFGFYPVWLAGAGLAELVLCRPQFLQRWWVAALVFGAGFVGYVCVPSVAAKVVCAVGFGMAAVLLAAGCAPEFSTRFPVCALEFLGIRSYTIYIMHFPLLALLSAWLFECRNGRPTSGWFALAGSAIVLGLCLCLFQICERRFLHERLRS